MPDCLAPLEVHYDLDAARKTFTRENIAARPSNLWRYAELLPMPEGYKSDLPVGMTPLVDAPRLGEQIGSRRLLAEKRRGLFPHAFLQRPRGGRWLWRRPKTFGFQTVSCSSTGNLANAVAAQAARHGFRRLDFHSCRSRAGQGAGHAGFWRAR